MINKFSFLGFCLTPLLSGTGCDVGYVTHTNPKGRLPSWVINKLSASIAPKFVKWLHKASIAYPEWKKKNEPDMKWWNHPEQITSPKVNIEEDVRKIPNKLNRSLSICKSYHPLNCIIKFSAILSLSVSSRRKCKLVIE